jgi:hypothetical protein
MTCECPINLYSSNPEPIIISHSNPLYMTIYIMFGYHLRYNQCLSQRYTSTQNCIMQALMKYAFFIWGRVQVSAVSVYCISLAFGLLRCTLIKSLQCFSKQRSCHLQDKCREREEKRYGIYREGVRKGERTVLALANGLILNPNLFPWCDGTCTAPSYLTNDSALLYHWP